jgi:hypothetical protein
MKQDIRCELCEFYNNIGGNTGKCQRFPPQIYADSCDFPHVHKDEWCGEFKPQKSIL